MSAAAIAAMTQCRQIIGMDSSSLRFKWREQDGEVFSRTMRRRREMLTAAGRSLACQRLDWDELPEVVRDALNEAHL